MPKSANKTGKKSKKSATIISPKQFRKLTKDGLKSLLIENKLSTTGTRPQLLQLLTRHMKSKVSPKRLRRTKRTRTQAGNTTPQRHPVPDSEPSGSEHSATGGVQNSGSEPSGSESFHHSVTRAGKKRPHRSVSPSGEHYHTSSRLPSGRRHSHRGVSPSGVHPRVLHLPSGRRRSSRHHSIPRKRRRYHRRADSSDSSSSSSYTSSTSSSTTTSSSSSSWTSSSNSGHYRRRRRAKHRRHYHRSRRYHAVDDWLNPSASGSIPCAPPLSRQLQHAIQRGKYVSFSKLLLPLDTPPLINQSKSKSHHDKTKHRVTILSSWLEAWNRYLCTRVAANPSMALELVKYQTMMVMFFKHHPAEVCIHYDKLFRQAAAQDRTLRWDLVKNDIYVWAVTQPSSRQPSASQRTQSFREKVPILARLGPPATPTASTPTRASHTPGGQEICRRYNFGKCTKGSDCSFAHVCWHPGCLGEHPAKGCPKKSN